MLLIVAPWTNWLSVLWWILPFSWHAFWSCRVLCDTWASRTDEDDDNDDDDDDDDDDNDDDQERGINNSELWLEYKMFNPN